MIRAILFDWGNTLMVDDGRHPGPMRAWPAVAACPHIREALLALGPRYTLAVATNADDSGGDDVRAALARVGIDRFFDRIFSSRDIGARKPDARFFRYILADMGLPPRETVMIGDSLENDVRAPVRLGLCALWYSPGGNMQDLPAGVRSYADHRELKAILESLAF